MIGHWRGRARSLSADEGYVLVTAFLLPALIMMVGLSFDLGMALQTRREVANIATESARFGATFIDEEEFRWNSSLVITEEGRLAASDFASQAGAQSVSVSVGRAQFATGETILTRAVGGGAVPARVPTVKTPLYIESDFVEVTVSKPVRYIFLAQFFSEPLLEATAKALAVDVLQNCQGSASCGN